MSRFSVLRSLSVGFALLLAPVACTDDGGTDDNADDNGTTTDTNDTGDTDTTDAGAVCGQEWAEKDGTTPSIMEDWGLPCMDDAPCIAALGDGGKCVTNILGVYDLPGGYCAKEGCALPDNVTTFVLDAPDCDPNGGIACVGVQNVYTVCAKPCENSSQCGREGYGCRIMPNIAMETDQTFCLMDPDDCCSIGPGQCG